MDNITRQYRNISDAIRSNNLSALYYLHNVYNTTAGDVDGYDACEYIQIAIQCGNIDIIKYLINYHIYDSIIVYRRICSFITESMIYDRDDITIYLISLYSLHSDEPNKDILQNISLCAILNDKFHIVEHLASVIKRKIYFSTITASIIDKLIINKARYTAVLDIDPMYFIKCNDHVAHRDVIYKILYNNQCPICHMIDSDDIDIAMHLTNNNINLLNYSDYIMMHSCRQGSLNIIKHMISIGLNVDFRDVLRESVSYGHVNILKYFISLHDPITKTPKYSHDIILKWTYGIIFNNINLDMITIMLSIGRTYCELFYSAIFTKNKNTEVVNYLICMHKINYIDYTTVMHLYDFYKTIRPFIEQINNSHYCETIIDASEFNDIETVKYIIDSGVQFDSLRTIKTASEYGNYDIFMVLSEYIGLDHILSYTAIKSITKKRNLTQSHFDIVKYALQFINKNEDISSLLRNAFCNKQIEMANLILSSRTDINIEYDRALEKTVNDSLPPTRYLISHSSNMCWHTVMRIISLHGDKHDIITYCIIHCKGVIDYAQLQCKLKQRPYILQLLYDDGYFDLVEKLETDKSNSLSKIQKERSLFFKRLRHYPCDITVYISS